jgi:hypothetical protein
MSDNAYQAYMAANQEGRSPYIGPSGAKGCYRQHAFRYLGVEPAGEFDWHTDAADFGTLLHLGWSAMIASRFDPADRRADVEVRIPGLPRSGSADDVDFVNRIVTDLKTAKDRGWQSWVNGEGPYDNYWDQLELYGLGLHTMYGGEWTLRIVGINRETGQYAEWERVQDLDRARDLAEMVAERHTALTGAVSLTAAGADPLELVEQFPREGAGPGRGMPCDWCPFVAQCWPEPVADGGSPQAATIVGDPEAVGRYAAEYLEASAAARKTDGIKRDLQAFLKGVEGEFPGPDGGTYKVAMVGGSAREVPDCDAMQERLTELGEPIPTVWSRRAAYPKVTRKKR